MIHSLINLFDAHIQAGDSNYQASSATTTGGGMLFVTPEYAWGLLGLVACIAAFALFIKLKRKNLEVAI